jgi:RND family efflux transporter MFP subunit
MISKSISLFTTLALIAVTALWAAALRADDLDCLLEPYQVVNLSSPVEGVLEAVYVDRGDTVKKGQAVAQLESTLEHATVTLARSRAEMDSAIKSSEARLALSTVRLTRREKLFEKELVSVDELQESQTEKKVAEMTLLNAIENKRLAQLELDRATVALSRRTVRSPLAGVVVERFLSPGEFTSGQFKSDAILKLAQIDPLRIEAFAPLSLRGKIAVGMQAKISIEAPANSSHDVRVTIVDRVIDSASSTFRVRLELPNPNLRIPAGLKCKVRFSLPLNDKVKIGPSPGS